MLGCNLVLTQVLPSSEHACMPFWLALCQPLLCPTVLQYTVSCCLTEALVVLQRFLAFGGSYTSQILLVLYDNVTPSPANDDGIHAPASLL